MADEKQADKPAKAPTKAPQSYEQLAVTKEAVISEAAALKPESAPKAAKLVAEMEPDGKSKKDQPPTPPTAAAKAPQLVHENERAPAGLKRFKMRCTNYRQNWRYVLATDRKAAESHYVKAMRLDEAIEVARSRGLDPEAPVLAVVELKD